jgi:hypothetical protein
MKHPAVIKIEVNRMVCTACGAEANASCACGKPYMPAKQRAADAIAANPQKSNRAIADEIGVSEPTVRRARDATASPDAVDVRVGLDGKTRRMPAHDDDDDGDGADVDVAAARFKAGAQDVIETAQDAIGFVRRIHFSNKSASVCVAMVDKIIAQWTEVKTAIQTRSYKP